MIKIKGLRNKLGQECITTQTITRSYLLIVEYSVFELHLFLKHRLLANLTGPCESTVPMTNELPSVVNRKGFSKLG